MIDLTDYFITAVHYEKNNGVKYISRIKVHKNTGGKPDPNSIPWEKQRVVIHINSLKQTFKTATGSINIGWTIGAKVNVVDDKYLRTDANKTPIDNLGNLPEF